MKGSTTAHGGRGDLWRTSGVSSDLIDSVVSRWSRVTTLMSDPELRLVCRMSGRGSLSQSSGRIKCSVCCSYYVSYPEFDEEGFKRLLDTLNYRGGCPLFHQERGWDEIPVCSPSVVRRLTREVWTPRIETTWKNGTRGRPWNRTSNPTVLYFPPSNVFKEFSRPV